MQPQAPLQPRREPLQRDSRGMSHVFVQRPGCHQEPRTDRRSALDLERSLPVSPPTESAKQISSRTEPSHSVLSRSSGSPASISPSPAKSALRPISCRHADPSAADHGSPKRGTQVCFQRGRQICCAVAWFLRTLRYSGPWDSAPAPASAATPANSVQPASTNSPPEPMLATPKELGR